MRNNNDRPTRRASGKRLAVALICLALSLVCSITLAYVFTTTKPVENKFTPATVGIDITEEFDGNVKENVSIMNTGDAECYIRATIVVTWKNDDGEIYPKQPVLDEDYTMSMGSGDTWLKAADGFWYYKSPVAAGDSTSILIAECKTVANKAPDGYHLSVEILSSAIQSKPIEAVESWSNYVSVGTDGNLVLKEVSEG